MNSSQLEIFLESKAIDRSVAESLGTVFDAEGVRYANGRTRTWDKKIRQPAGTKLKPWYLRGKPNEGQSLLVTEGETDALAAESHNATGVAVVSIPGSSTPPERFVQQVEALGGPKVYLAFDGDEAGRAATKKFVEALSSVCVVAVVPIEEGSDLSDTLVASSEPSETLADLLSAAEVQTNVVALRPPEEGGLHALPVAELGNEKVDWLMDGFIPLGAVTILAGDPGFGKSMFATMLTAQTTLGTTDGALTASPAPAMFCSVEDDPHNTIRPRMEAAGANLEKVLLMSRRMHNVDHMLTIPDDIPALEEVVARIRPRLLVLDPLVAFFPPNIDSNRNQDVRRALAPLVKLAEDYEVAILAVNHLTKNDSTDLLKRIGGSGGLPAASRSVIFLGPNPADPKGMTRILSHEKCNVGVLQASKLLEISTVGQTTRMDVTGISPFDAADSLELGGSLYEIEKRLLAVKFLREELEIEDQSAKHLQTTAAPLGIGHRELAFARKELNASYYRNVSNGQWMLKLPDREQAQEVPDL